MNQIHDKIIRTLYYYTWSNIFPGLPYIIRDIEEQKPNRILFSDMEECEYPSDYPDLIEELNILIDKYEIDFIFIFGSTKTNFYLNDFSSRIKCRRFFFPLFWLYKTYSHLSDSKNFNPNSNYNIDKLYISLNNNDRYHRAMLIDSLCENNLLKYGYISWLKINNSYKWNCWEQKIINLDKEIIKEHLEQYETPLEYKKVLVNIISETSISALFLTEKTFVSILLKQPFLILGARNIHQLLVEYGFQLYDEIFDYSFDNYDSLDERIHGIIENLLKLKDKNYFHLRDLITSKVEFNFDHAKNIIDNKLFIPNEIKILLNELNRNYDVAISAKNLKGFIFPNLEEINQINKII